MHCIGIVVEHLWHHLTVQFVCPCRTPEPQQSLLPPVTRSMSVPDSGSVWEMQNSSTQASCSPNMQPTTPSSTSTALLNNKIRTRTCLELELFLSVEYVEANVLKSWSVSLHILEQSPSVSLQTIDGGSYSLHLVCCLEFLKSLDQQLSQSATVALNGKLYCLVCLFSTLTCSNAPLI